MAQYSVKRGINFHKNNNDIFEVQMTADEDGNIINSFGAAANIPIASGASARHTHVHKFGYNPAVGNNYEDIWSRSGKIVFETSAAVATIDSNLANVGCEITIQGLDGNYDAVSETVTLDASGDASTTQTFIRINRAFVSGSTAISNVVRIQINGSNQAQIDVAHQQTMQAIYTVPRGHTAYFHHLSMGLLTKDKDVEARINVCEFGGVERTRDYLTFSSNFIEKHYPIPLKFPEKSDLKLQAQVTGNDTSMSGTFDLILVKDR